MTGNQFENEIIQPGQPLKIINQTVKDIVDLQKDIIALGVILENCTFEEDVAFTKIDMNCGLKFINCVFKKQFVINECKAKNFDFQFNFTNYHLEFIKTTIEELHFKGVNQIQRGVRIREKSTINALHVGSVISEMGSFAIIDSTINNQFDIYKAIIKNDISIRGNTLINAIIRFENIEAGSLVFTEATFNKDIHIWAGKVDNIIFNDGLYSDTLFIDAVSISSSLTVIRADFKKSLVLNIWDKSQNLEGSLKKVHITSAKLGGWFIVRGNNTRIDGININTSRQLEGAYSFSQLNIEKAKLSGDNYNSNIVFNHCNFNNLIFDQFYNYATLSIISAKSFDHCSCLSILDSNLGKTHLFDVSLNSFHKISIYKSVITEIITANVVWFSEDKLNPENSVAQHKYPQRKEVYRQLKFALEKQGNRISSLRFKALEMKAYKQELFEKVKWPRRLADPDRFVLWVGQTNDFGLNWMKPALLAVGFSLFFHFLIVIGVSEELSYVPNLSIQSFVTTMRIYWQNIDTLPQLMNPTHFLSKIYPAKIDLTFTVHFLDYVLKLVLAFFIFQTISAFRKYVR